MIHYKDGLFYVGVNEERKATVPVESFLKNFFEGKKALMVDTYFNEGKSVADSISIEWKDNQFFKYEIDRSQL